MMCGGWQWSCATAGAFVMALGLFGAPTEAQRSHFNLPADTIERSIKRFAAQSGLEVLIPADDLPRKVKTRPVRGRMTSLQALKAMLRGTGLTVVMDPKTGAVAVRWTRADPPGSAADEDASSADDTKTPKADSASSDRRRAGTARVDYFVMEAK